MLRIATLTATLAALLALPAAAHADSTYTFIGVLVHRGQPAADAVSVTSAGTKGKPTYVVRETASPAPAPGYGCTALPPDASECDAGQVLFGADVKTLDGDDSVVVDAVLPAAVDGGSGNDRLTGGAYGDTLYGQYGNDVLDGRGGSDTIKAGPGNDTIEARDGVKDAIDCGDGTDTFNADAVDLLTSCGPDPVTPAATAQTNVPPPPTPTVEDKLRTAPPAVVNPLPDVAPVALVAAAVQVGRDGVAPLELGCAASEAAGCRGELFLDPAPKGRALGVGPKRGKRHGGAKVKKVKVRAYMARRGRFGRSPFVIAAGQKAKLQVNLTPEARRALALPAAKTARAARRGRRVKARVTVVQKGRKASVSIIELRG